MNIVEIFIYDHSSNICDRQSLCMTAIAARIDVVMSGSEKEDQWVYESASPDLHLSFFIL